MGKWPGIKQFSKDTNGQVAHERLLNIISQKTLKLELQLIKLNPLKNDKN